MAYSFIDLKQSYYNNVQGIALSDSGDVFFTGSVTFGEVFETAGYIYSNGLATQIFLTNQLTVSISLSNEGFAFGNRHPSTLEEHGFVIEDGLSTQIKHPLAPAFTSLVASNESGTVVGNYIDAAGDQQGFMLLNGTYTTIEPSEATTAVYVTDVNESGEVIGYYELPEGGRRGFQQQDGSFESIVHPLGSNTTLMAINDLGEIVGVRNVDSVFLYKDGEFYELGDVVSPTLRHADINNLGEIVFNDVNSSYHSRGGITTQIDMPTGVSQMEVFNINDLGQIAGKYLTGSEWHPFLANPIVPETTVLKQVAGLYAAVYNRAADDIGMDYWLALTGQAGDAAVTLANAEMLGRLFVQTQSTYFNETYGSLDNAAFVNALYENIGGQSAENQAAVNYWVGVLNGHLANGMSMLDARASVVGKFVHDLVETNLVDWTSDLTPDELAMAIVRQATVTNKLDVSLAYMMAAGGAGGALLNAHAIGDAAFDASIRVMQGLAVDPFDATDQKASIQAAIASQSLNEIQPVGGSSAMGEV